MLAQTAGLLLFTGVSPGGSYVSDVLAASLLVAIGIGLSFVPATISAVAGVAPHEAGLASGLVNTSRLFGGALGLAILAALATSRTNSELKHIVVGPHALHAAMASGFDLAFGVAAGFAFVGGVIAMVGLPRIKPRPREQPPQAEPREAVAAN
jgi:MFS family permease